jgi:hypothetical protein
MKYVTVSHSHPVEMKAEKGGVFKGRPLKQIIAIFLTSPGPLFK